jgi:hypothetical protein
VTAASGKGGSNTLKELGRADWSRAPIQPVDDARPRVNNGDSKSKQRRQGGRQKGGDGKGGGWDSKGEQWRENWRSE